MIVPAFIVHSFGVSMVHSMLSGTASMDFGGKKASGTAAGLFDGMQYLGGAFAGIGMGKMLDIFGWSVWPPMIIGVAALGAVLMIRLWNVSGNKKA